MSAWTVIIIADLLLWAIIAVNVMYVLFFALASLLPQRQTASRPYPQGPAAGRQPQGASAAPSFLVLFPAYREDAVIQHSVETFLLQDYPQKLYQVIVISDQMEAETNDLLRRLPVTVLLPAFEQSSKARALQYAIDKVESGERKVERSDYVVILDADNIVASNFLSQLAQTVRPDEAIQCHRTAKNADNDIAALDGISEEINNSIFRRGHNRIGLSSALIGSGMCFSYEWFRQNVVLLDSAVEDRELEVLLLKQGIFVRYAEDIIVKDEKVSNSDNFQRQRLRWMTGQVQAFFRMLPYLPKAIVTANINYIDKTIQQALIPRSILLVLTPLFTILSFFTLHSSIFNFQSSIIKWLVLLIALVLSIVVAIPNHLRTTALLRKVLALPRLVGRMLNNILHIRTQNKEFIHTTHHHN